MLINRIVLCGFMGCGKSTVGKSLAKRLDWQLVDTDAQIAHLAGKSIPEIFATQGEAGFRTWEHHCAQSLAQAQSTVIATGGGMLISAQNAALFQTADTLVVFLATDFRLCYLRIRNTARPLVQANNKARLLALYRERYPLYKKAAHLTVNRKNLTATVAAILEAVDFAQTDGSVQQF